MPGISLSRMGSRFSFLENGYGIKNEFPNFDETFIFLSKYFFPTWIFVYFIQGVTAWVLKIHTPVLYYITLNNIQMSKQKQFSDRKSS